MADILFNGGDSLQWIIAKNKLIDLLRSNGGYEVVMNQTPEILEELTRTEGVEDVKGYFKLKIKFYN